MNTNQYVSVVEKSGDTKLSKNGNVSATWVSQASCPGADPRDPKPCPFFGNGSGKNGCYGELGRAALATRRLNTRTADSDLSMDDLRLELARQEAEGIRGLTGLRKLRSKAVGDCTNAQQASIVGSAMVDHEKKHGKAAWTYTHASEQIPHDAWQGARVLASCHTVEEVQRARVNGYGTALVVPQHPTHKVYTYQGETIIPCPAQLNKAVTCEHCTLCQRPDWLRDHRMSVGFQPDRGTTAKVLKLIKVA